MKKPTIPKGLEETPRRPLLTVADALDFAAEQLSTMATDQRLIVTITGLLKEKGGDLLKDAPSGVKNAMIEPERQERSLREAARIVRDLSVEQRILDLRELDRLRERL